MKQRVLYLILIISGLAIKSYGNTFITLDDSLKTTRLCELLEKGDDYDRQYDTYHAFYAMMLLYSWTPHLILYGKLPSLNIKGGIIAPVLRFWVS